MTNKTPVLLLTGYLGSGKTTLVNRILNNSKGIKFAVIVNDIGEVNIDANLIQQGGVVGMKDDSLVALQNGCICCTLKMDLVEQLHQIIALHRFDYIVIEASGICEPGPIAQTIESIPRMEEKYTKDGVPQLDCIVTVVDALRIRDEFGCGDDLVKKNIGEEDLENLVIQQIEFCNIVLLNKASEVSADEMERIRKVVRALQPRARIGTLLVLLQQLLYAVFPAGGQSRPDSLPHPVGVVHLGGADEQDVLGIPAGLLRRPSDVGLHLGQILRNGHRKPSLCMEINGQLCPQKC